MLLQCRQRAVEMSIKCRWNVVLGVGMSMKFRWNITEMSV